MRKHLIFLVVILSSAMALITPGVALGQKTVLANYNPTQDNYAIDIPKFIACLREVGLEQN